MGALEQRAVNGELLQQHLVAVLESGLPLAWSHLATSHLRPTPSPSLLPVQCMPVEPKHTLTDSLHCNVVVFAGPQQVPVM